MLAFILFLIFIYYLARINNELGHVILFKMSYKIYDFVVAMDEEPLVRKNRYWIISKIHNRALNAMIYKFGFRLYGFGLEGTLFADLGERDQEST